MEYIKIIDFLERLKAIKVLVVGDLMLDEYLWGNIERISPEAPVQIVDVRNEEIRLGGAGNVLNNLISLGCRVHVASVVGDEPDGYLLRDLLLKKGISCENVLFDNSRKTSRKTRILSSNQQMLRVDRESRNPISSEFEIKLIENIKKFISEFQVILVSDYLKGVLTDNVLQDLISLGRKSQIPVIIDPKGNDYIKYKGATLLTPNCKEAQTATQIPIFDKKSLQLAGQHLINKLKLNSLLITRGEEGMTLFLQNDQDVHLPVQALEVYDVSGAGDTVLAVIGAGVACDFSLKDAAKLANLAAGIVVGKVGTSPITAEDLLDAVSLPTHSVDRKIKNIHRLKQIISTERNKGKSIVFTNGCFDLLHSGHVKYLQQASLLGDVLILGLNSDDSVRRLKGPRRPLLKQDERAQILAAFNCIDHIVIFEEDNPLELIETIRPNILVKGGDYTPEKVVGKEFVESYGGRVELIRLVDGKSTTKIIEKIIHKYHKNPVDECKII
jgi:D-beta-D-heptose 7-phosphate kinase/D-beta-D-heptose 1-phosphate adenosyltransferase